MRIGITAGGTARATGVCAAVLLALANIAAGAEARPLSFAAPFSDHAVLQRGQAVRIWGTGTPRARVAIDLGTRHLATRVGVDGRWSALFAPLPAGGPLTLTAHASDGSVASLHDLLVGDVWLCSGQSNMELKLRFTSNAEFFLSQPGDGAIRMLTVPQRWAAAEQAGFGAPAQWQVIDPRTAGDASAACYHMSRTLHAQEHVPIGMIDASFGGTLIESWISQAGLARIGGFSGELKYRSSYEPAPDRARAEWWAHMAAWWRAHEPGAAEKSHWPQPDFDDRNWPVLEAGSNWTGSGLKDLGTFDGVVWLRGKFTLTAADAKAVRSIELGAIDDCDTSFVNGVEIGATDGGTIERRYTVPPGLLHAGTNVIAVRVFNVFGGGGMWSPKGSRALRLADGSSRPLPESWHYRISAPVTAFPAPPIAPWSEPFGVTGLFNGMIAPLRGYGLRGVAWYQGEANTYAATQYEPRLKGLVADWRAEFRLPQLPFVIAQLSSFGKFGAAPGPSGWATVRDAQRRVAALQNVGLAVTIDVGDPYDIHPTQKSIVGERLARAAERVAYDRDIPQSPVPIGVQRVGADILVQFSGAAPFVMVGGDTALGFEICGDVTGCRYVRAVAQDSAVRLEGANRPDANRVRYAWSDAPIVNLFSADRLPVSPFEVAVSPGDSPGRSRSNRPSRPLLAGRH